MQKFKKVVQICLSYVSVIVIAGTYPLSAFAETTPGATPLETVTAPVTTTPPSTPVEPPAPTYTYNPETKRWDSDQWVYNPTSGRYEPAPQPVVMPLPAPEITASDPSTIGTTGGGASTITDTTKSSIDNALKSDATTGNATVTKNTTAGNASTGDAAAVATIMNTINSSVSVSGADFATFVTDINGDVHGDIMLYPMLLKAMLQAAKAPPAETAVKVTTDASISNDINLKATSGDAAVTSNTTAGDATSGSANTVANVMNMINSIIAANQSFVGTVNIYGNLDGDILLAPDFLPQLLASNAANPSHPDGSSLVVSAEDTQSIVNNIDLSAISGKATVENNTKAGSATTGGAQTNLVLLNLSGHQIVANDSLLIFVNVLGQWVGMIVDAPQGASAAALGTGVTTGTVSPALTINADNNSRIVNNINLASQTGDATVANNTTGGNAATGNATASANVANISGSQFGLTGWFGMLFINVFGRWDGSFGIDTPSGNPLNVHNDTNAGSGSPNARPTQPFQFVPKSSASTNRSTAMALPDYSTSNGTNASVEVGEVTFEEDDNGTVLAASSSSTPLADTKSAQPNGQVDIIPYVSALAILGLGGLATRNLINLVRSRNGVGV